VVAVDTNVLVRLLTGDQPRELAAAHSLFASTPVWIAKTVLLETSWVLRSQYEFDNAAIREAFTRLLGLDDVNAEEPRQIAAALALTTQGIDFADALHLCSRPPACRFISFDRAFIRRAKRAGVPDTALL
jgi:predicted nucleic-acid-binding protein